MCHVSKRERRSFTKEYKAEVVDLVRDSGKSVGTICRELDLTETAVRRWVKQAEVDKGQGPVGALTTAEREELRQLRRDNRELRMEREILKKATAFFAKESKCDIASSTRRRLPTRFVCCAVVSGSRGRASTLGAIDRGMALPGGDHGTLLAPHRGLRDEQADRLGPGDRCSAQSARAASRGSRRRPSLGLLVCSPQTPSTPSAAASVLLGTSWVPLGDR